MKKAPYILLAVALMTFSPCLAEEPSPLRFNETEWDFGTIREEGGIVGHVFGFTNAGPHPIAIDRINTSCGCTTPEYTRDPIRPGGKAQIKVNYDPMGFPLEFEKSVMVISGGGKYRNELTIKGYVTPRVKPIEEVYPDDMGGGLRLDNTLLAFRQIAQEHSSSMTVGYANTSDKSIAIEMIAEEQSGLLTLHAPENICAGCKGTITATYDLTGKPDSYGMIHDVLKIAVDGAVSRKTIYTSMTGVDDFSGMDIETAPRLFLDSQYHNFGEVRRRTIPYTLRLVASNEGKEILHIRSISEKPGFKTTLRSGMTIAPGASLPFEVVFYSDRYDKGNIIESLIMVVDDPMRPVREIRISAKIQ